MPYFVATDFYTSTNKLATKCSKQKVGGGRSTAMLKKTVDMITCSIPFGTLLAFEIHLCKWAKITKSGKWRKLIFCNNFFKIGYKLIL